MSKTQQYNLDPTGKTEVTITLAPQENTYFTVGTDPTQVQTFTVGQVGVQKPAQAFTLHTDGNYASAMIEVQYIVPPGHSGPNWNPPSYCHVYFQPGGADWIWSGELITGDNPTVLVAGEGLQNTQDVKLQVPTTANPAQGGSQYQCLEDSIVFLLDKKANGNMLFRGNEPLAPGTSNQLVDFDSLHNTLTQKYFLQTGLMDFPAKGSYVLRDIAFLGSDEDGMMLQELKSFGGNDIRTQLANQAWYPLTAAKVNGSDVLGQMSNWNVEPEGSGQHDGPNVQFDARMATQLSTWMNTQETDANGNPIPYIYYIHCASGHDRTGIACSTYLVANRDMDVSDAFIMGTTINKLSIPMGGNLVQNCDDVGTTTVDSYRSRCFVIAQVYNTTIVDVYNNLKGVTTGALSSTAISGDPAISEPGTAYVQPYYPWFPYSPSVKFTVNSKDPWQGTGTTLTAGQTLNIAYLGGKWTANPRDNHGELFNAAGNPAYVANQSGYPMQGQNEGALVGRIGATGEVFIVGNGPMTMIASVSGELQLCINDDLEGLYGAGLTDNEGEVTVLINA